MRGPVRVEPYTSLEGMECDALGNCRVPEVGPDVMGRHCDAGIQPMCCSQSLDHRCGHSAPLTSVAVLKLCHHPGKFSHR